MTQPISIFSLTKPILSFVKKYSRNSILCVFSIITRITQRDLVVPSLRGLLFAYSEEEILYNNTHAKPICKYSNLVPKTNINGVDVNSKYAYSYSDLDKYRIMVEKRQIRKYVPSTYQWLIGLGKTSKTLFINDNKFRDVNKIKYLQALKRQHLQVYINNCVEFLSKEVPNYINMNKTFTEDGMNLHLHNLSIKLLCICHLGYIPDNKQIENFRIQSSPINFGVGIGDIINLLFNAGPSSRKFYRNEIDKRLYNKNSENSEITILNKWIEAGMDIETLNGELMHNISLTSGAISNQLNHVMYYLWKHPELKQRLLIESCDVDILNLDEIDNLVELDKFNTELGRNVSTDFGLSVTLEDTCDIPKKCPFSFKHYTAGFDNKHWDETYSRFDPDRFDDHIKNNQSERKHVKNGIELTKRGEFVSEDLFIPNYEGFSAFGIGSRNCPGFVLVSYLVKIFTIIMIRNYNWKAVNIELIESKVFIGVLAPHVGDNTRMKLCKRE